MIQLNKRNVVVLLLAIFIVITPMMGHLYSSVHLGGVLGTSEDMMSLQLMAVDHNPHGEFVLQRDGDRHVIELGDWYQDTVKTYPAAFAIVNPHPDRQFIIRKISLVGEDDLGNLEIWLHRHQNKPCNPDLVNTDDHESNGHKKLYYQDGTPIVYDDDGWVLGSGTGYGEDGMEYSNTTMSATAHREDGIWVHNTTGPISADEGSNFVWVEISVRPDSEASTGIFQGPLDIHIVEHQFEPQIGSGIEFMSAGRRQGSPVLYRDGVNNITLTFNDMIAGTRVIIPDAFAIVNLATTPLKVNNLTIDGDIQYMNISLHGDPDKVCTDIGIGTDDTAIQYHPEGPATEWVLGPGQGYNEYSQPVYGDSNATRLGGHPDQRYYVWTFDPDGNNVATDGIDNFVWVEIAFDIPEDIIGKFKVSLTFHFSST